MKHTMDYGIHVLYLNESLNEYLKIQSIQILKRGIHPDTCYIDRYSRFAKKGFKRRIAIFQN